MKIFHEFFEYFVSKMSLFSLAKISWWKYSPWSLITAFQFSGKKFKWKSNNEFGVTCYILLLYRSSKRNWFSFLTLSVVLFSRKCITAFFKVIQEDERTFLSADTIFEYFHICVPTNIIPLFLELLILVNISIISEFPKPASSKTLGKHLTWSKFNV